jgi:Bacterial regulatory proteins, tetR family
MFRNIFSSPVSSHPMESSMPYPAEHHHLTKHKIIRSARRRFNRHGFDAVSIDDVMAGAGLSHAAASTLTSRVKVISMPKRSPMS